MCSSNVTSEGSGRPFKTASDQHISGLVSPSYVRTFPWLAKASDLLLGVLSFHQIAIVEDSDKLTGLIRAGGAITTTTSKQSHQGRNRDQRSDISVVLAEEIWSDH